jgi:hypothetical protein
VTDYRSAHGVATWALCCARDALLNADREPVQRAFVAAGQVAWDDCCGMLVAAPERVFRTLEFPNENSTEEVCFGGHLAVEVVVLLVRCVPTVDERGRAPSSEALDAAYRSLIEDSAIVWNAAVCCDLPDDWVRASVSQTFVGAQGGCIGSETRFIIGIPQQRWAIG